MIISYSAVPHVLHQAEETPLRRSPSRAQKETQHFRTFCGSFTTEKFISMIRVFLQLSSAQNPFKVQEKKKIPHILLEDDLFKIFRK